VPSLFAVLGVLSASAVDYAFSVSLLPL